jgi:hypothetical protein
MRVAQQSLIHIARVEPAQGVRVSPSPRGKGRWTTHSKSLPLALKTMMATSAEHKTPSSYAFLKSPFLRFRNVTWRFLSSLIGAIEILRRPMLAARFDELHERAGA